MDRLFWYQMKSLEPMSSLIKRDGHACDVSFLIPAKNCADTLVAAVEQVRQYLLPRFVDSFEIIIIPNVLSDHPEDKTEAVAHQLAARYPDEVKAVSVVDEIGKGVALRAGFFASKGRNIFFTDADVPYDLRFFDEAVELLRTGAALVTGNRRLMESEFQIPVTLLPIAYKRHRLGLLFNSVVKFLLPIRTTDTQAGIKAMSRELAQEVFTRQTCPGFFFDLEIFLTAAAHKMSTVEIPVTLTLTNEKSTVRILRESVLAGVWIAKIFLNYWAGYYRRADVAL